MEVKSCGEEASGESTFGKILGTFMYASSFPTRSSRLAALSGSYLRIGSPYTIWHRFHMAS